MKKNFLVVIISIISCLVSVSLSSAGTDCLRCHKKLAAKKVVHPALSMGCAACHEGIDAGKIPHRISNKIEKGLSAAQPGLCYECHDAALFNKRHVHPPVAAGQCTICHFPHSSDNAFLLEKPVRKLCISCHEDKSSGKHVLAGYGLGDNHPVGSAQDPSHPNRELSCISCHSPHASDGEFLFPQSALPSGNVCSLCHKKIMVKP